MWNRVINKLIESEFQTDEEKKTHYYRTLQISLNPIWGLTDSEGPRARKDIMLPTNKGLPYQLIDNSVNHVYRIDLFHKFTESQKSYEMGDLDPVVFSLYSAQQSWSPKFALFVSYCANYNIYIPIDGYGLEYLIKERGFREI